ncbi:hypothetical protein JKP88DRAFT_284283 [Tribonema minus]|uniref:DUF1279 domain-containing protein n=1 Tax=Tribonema minus TaxID=303371 RepID=A0A835ZET6_9STRA|nr:hypothetical protein JKP88DRAFT_284283 [Tribonema minus]
MSSNRLSHENLLRFARKYGPVAGVVHSSVYVCTLGSMYTAIASGLDLTSLLAQIPLMDQDLLTANAAAGHLAVAYGATMLTGPMRAVVTITATPAAADVWNTHIKPRPAPLGGRLLQIRQRAPKARGA